MLYCVLLYTQSTLQSHGGGGGSLLNHHQNIKMDEYINENILYYMTLHTLKKILIECNLYIYIYIYIIIIIIFFFKVIGINQFI